MSYPPPQPQQPWPPQAYQDPQVYQDPAWQSQFARPPRKRRRVFPWVFLAIQVLFIIWVIAGAASGHSAAVNCHDQYLTHQECANATEAGAAIGVGLVVVLWAVVDIILGISYGVWRLARR